MYNVYIWCPLRFLGHLYVRCSLCFPHIKQQLEEETWQNLPLLPCCIECFSTQWKTAQSSFSITPPLSFVPAPPPQRPIRLLCLSGFAWSLFIFRHCLFNRTFGQYRFFLCGSCILKKACLLLLPSSFSHLITILFLENLTFFPFPI